MGKVITGKFSSIDDFEVKPVVEKRARSQEQFCAKCGFSNKLVVTGTGTLCGCCGTELTWH